MSPTFILLAAVLLIAAIFSTKISDRFGVPVLLLFLGIGMLAGSDVLGLVYFDDTALAQKIATVALIFIIFEGGFRTRKSSLAVSFGPALSLATLGVAATAAILGLLIHAVAGYSLLTSLLVGAMISSTDVAAVLGILRRKAIRRRVSSTIEIESAANDPMAILLTLFILQFAAGKTGSPLELAGRLAWQIGGGIGAGFLVSALARVLFDRLDTDNRGYYQALSIGVALLAYGAAEALGANGIVAVFFAGYWLGNADFVYKRGVAAMIEGVSTFSNMALFLLLGLLVFPKSLVTVWREGLLIAFLVIFLARPVAVILCTAPFRFSWRERLFIMWGGLKGAVPIVLATYPAAYGLDPDHRMFDLVFFAVLVSCLAQGSTLDFAARRLGLVEPGPPPLRHTVELLATRKSELDMFELRIERMEAEGGFRIGDLSLPEGVLITSIVRDDTILAPKGGTRLRQGDILFVLAPEVQAEAISAELNAH